MTVTTSARPARLMFSAASSRRGPDRTRWTSDGRRSGAGRGQSRWRCSRCRRHRFRAPARRRSWPPQTRQEPTVFLGNRQSIRVGRLDVLVETARRTACAAAMPEVSVTTSVAATSEIAKVAPVPSESDRSRERPLAARRDLGGRRCYRAHPARARGPRRHSPARAAVARASATQSGMPTPGTRSRSRTTPGARPLLRSIYAQPLQVTDLVLRVRTLEAVHAREQRRRRACRGAEGSRERSRTSSAPEPDSA